MCIPREALISALVGRARAGYEVTRTDLAALLQAGVPPQQLHQAFAGDAPALAHARRLVESITMAK